MNNAFREKLTVVFVFISFYLFSRAVAEAVKFIAYNIMGFYSYRLNSFFEKSWLILSLLLISFFIFFFLRKMHLKSYVKIYTVVFVVFLAKFLLFANSLFRQFNVSHRNSDFYFLLFTEVLVLVFLLVCLTNIKKIVSFINSLKAKACSIH